MRLVEFTTGDETIFVNPDHVQQLRSWGGEFDKTDIWFIDGGNPDGEFSSVIVKGRIKTVALKLMAD